jgi:hypothetical protein
MLIEYNPPVAILLLDLPSKLLDGNMLDEASKADGDPISYESEKLDVEVGTNRIFIYTHAAFLEVDEVFSLYLYLFYFFF